MKCFSRVWFAQEDHRTGEGKYHLPHLCLHSVPLRRTEQYEKLLGQSNSPVVLLAVPGIVSSYRRPLLPTSRPPTNLRMFTHVAGDVLRVARVFMAIGECTRKLRKLYKDLSKSTEEVPPVGLIWPNPTADPSVPNGTVRIKELHL